MTIILFFIILAVLVLVHEAGHFFAAKQAGIFVEEFGLGFPPKLLSWKKGETTYTLNAIPFGGFVKIAGEDGDVKGPAGRNFRDANRLRQAFILVAGVLSNVVFAWGLLTLGFMLGFPVSVEDYPNADIKNPQLMIVGTMPSAPAEEAGIRAGDVVLSTKSGSDVLTDFSPEGFRNFIINHPKTDVEISYNRGGEIGTAKVRPGQVQRADQPAIGVILDTVGMLSLPLDRAFVEGAQMTYRVGEEVVTGLWFLVTNAFRGMADFSNVSGPVGIAGVVGDARDLGFIYVLSFTAFISINLAVLNLLPFPALDGGRLFFLLIEAIIRKPLNEKFTKIANTGGFLILLILMVLVTFKDILKFF